MQHPHLTPCRWFFDCSKSDGGPTVHASVSLSPLTGSGSLKCCLSNTHQIRHHGITFKGAGGSLLLLSDKAGYRAASEDVNQSLSSFMNTTVMII